MACELQSQVAAVAAGFLARLPNAQVVYVMTDGGTLIADQSEVLRSWKEAKLLGAVVTAGQCQGGDLEAINVYSGLLLARYALGAQFIVVSQGVGEADTGTRFGFSGIEQGEAANAVASLGGYPMVCLRWSSADPSAARHAANDHTLTILDRVVRCRCAVAIARDAPGKRRHEILEAMEALQLHERHDILSESRGEPGLGLLESRGVPVPGGSFDQDREFYLHASAAGAAAAEMVELNIEIST